MKWWENENADMLSVQHTNPSSVEALKVLRNKRCDCCCCCTAAVTSMTSSLMLGMAVKYIQLIDWCLKNELNCLILDIVVVRGSQATLQTGSHVQLLMWTYRKYRQLLKPPVTVQNPLLWQNRNMVTTIAELVALKWGCNIIISVLKLTELM